ncbi:hypothetical protein HNY73_000566 [Argiope bruennichi]|uniref:Uncharacterized protein n=1 Tax=Argiope bruennichi TaxID=94029 RepID=A0A8T0FZG6_ARGBR|nr:hypothetical protein HNY73_000566 [Argiope bruennichi]
MMSTQAAAFIAFAFMMAVLAMNIESTVGAPHFHQGGEDGGILPILAAGAVEADAGAAIQRRKILKKMEEMLPALVERLVMRLILD